MLRYEICKPQVVYQFNGMVLYHPREVTSCDKYVEVGSISLSSGF